MEPKNEKERKARFLSCGDNIINIDAIHRIEILWKDIVHPFDKFKTMRKGEPEPEDIRYWVSVKCVDGSPIQISKMYPSYEEALAFYRKISDALRSHSDVELIEVKEDE